MRICGFHYFRTSVMAEWMESGTCIALGLGYAKVSILISNIEVHRFALGTENAETMQIKLITCLSKFVYY